MRLSPGMHTLLELVSFSGEYQVPPGSQRYRSYLTLLKHGLVLPLDEFDVTRLTKTGTDLAIWHGYWPDDVWPDDTDDDDEEEPIDLGEVDGADSYDNEESIASHWREIEGHGPGPAWWGGQFRTNFLDEEDNP